MGPDDLAGRGDQGQPGLVLYAVTVRDQARGVERDRVAQRRAETGQVSPIRVVYVLLCRFAPP